LDFQNPLSVSNTGQGADYARIVFVDPNGILKCATDLRAETRLAQMVKDIDESGRRLSIQIDANTLPMLYEVTAPVPP